MEKHQTLQQNNTDFYTPTGIHVYFKEPVAAKIDVENVVAKLESKIPSHLLEEIEMIIVGWFEEFEERDINAFYDGGTIYVSNLQDDEEDMYDDLVHEVAHSVESPHGYYLYADEKIKNEFLAKRSMLHDILWNMGYKTPKSFFNEIEFNQEFDDFLHKKVGYDKLARVMQGLFINVYAATSLREYFATAFTDFYLDSNHNFLQKVSPAVYEKLINIQNEEFLDSM
tara:strand:- start:24 stop:701 length:678 start_codon:yes stop_codon:yes gene_type:complete